MNTRIRQLKDDGAFTLVELLIVIVVLGVLAGVTVLAVGGVDKRGVEAACKSDVKSVEVAEQAHYAKHRAYTDVAGLVSAKFLSSAPSNPEYTVTASAATGAVTVSPACSTLN